MEWFNFNNVTFRAFFIITIVLLIFIAFMVVSYLLSSKRDSHYDNRIKAEATTLRIYIIDPKKSTVTYFNRSDLRNKKEIDIILLRDLISHHFSFPHGVSTQLEHGMTSASTA